MRDADQPLSKDGTPEFYIVYKECVDVGLSPLLTMEVTEKDASERETGETPQVVCPSEQIVQVGFLLEKYVGEDDEQEAFNESIVIKRLADDCFNKD